MKLVTFGLLALTLLTGQTVLAQPIQDYSGQPCTARDTDSVKCALCMLQANFYSPQTVNTNTEAEQREAVRMVLNLALRDGRSFCGIIHSPGQFKLAKRLKAQNEMKVSVDAVRGALNEGPNDFCQMNPPSKTSNDTVKINTVTFKFCPTRWPVKPAVNEPAATGS